MLECQMIGNENWKIVEKTRRRKKQNIKSSQKTFHLSVSAGLDYGQFRKVLSDWNEISIREIHHYKIDLIYVDGGHNDKRLYNIMCILKSLINDKKNVITNKWNLFVNMQNRFPIETEKHMVQTRLLEEIKEIQEDEILLIKPIGRNAFAGKDILCVTKMEELNNAKEKLKNYQQVMAVNYIKNPLLIDEKKFHIRSYMLVTTHPYEVVLFNKSKILTAKEKYQQGDYYNKNIHDTHVSSTTINRYFPFDMTMDDMKKEHILKQMNDIVLMLKEILRNNAEPYPESKYGFEVFGIDFIVSDDYTVYLIEVNDKIGMKSANDGDKKYSEFSHEYFKWIYENAIEPIFE